VIKWPAFQRFLKRLQDDPPAVVAVYVQSRSFRKTRESGEFFALMGQCRIRIPPRPATWPRRRGCRRCLARQHLVVADVEGLDPALLAEREADEEPSSTSSSVVKLACRRSQSASSAMLEPRMMARSRSGPPSHAVGKPGHGLQATRTGRRRTRSDRSSVRAAGRAARPAPQPGRSQIDRGGGRSRVKDVNPRAPAPRWGHTSGA
jgi:hypothetical protein